MVGNSQFICLQHLSKHFGPVKAVDNVDMTIAEGEFFSLLGASGCGKTTLLRMLAGFEMPTVGDILIDNVSMVDVAPHHRPTNMVFQSYAIFPHLNVRQNIAYGLRAQKLGRQETNRLVDEMLDVVKLPGFGDRRSNELSGGQRQRVALARALIKRPKVLLLDEPLGALDKKLREQMQLELRTLQQSLGITFIFVTHDQEEAMTLSDRVAVMSQGQVLQVGAPKELYNMPANIEVAKFIGQMNFIEATVAEANANDVTLDASGLGHLKANSRPEFARKGAPVLAAIRPEKLTLSDSPAAGAQNCIQGVIEAAAYLGDRSHFYVWVDSCKKTFAVAAQETGVLKRQSFELGSSVWLSWANESVIVLDRGDSQHAS